MLGWFLLIFAKILKEKINPGILDELVGLDLFSGRLETGTCVPGETAMGTGE